MIVCNFLGYVVFYQHFIKDFSEITTLLCNWPVKYVAFDFSKKCSLAFNTALKEKLTSTPMIISSNWSLPFELMCDASDYTIGPIGTS